MDPLTWTPDAIAGDWHLLDESADERNIPGHRMDLRFRYDAGHLRGAVLSRLNGAEMPIVHDASFNGRVLTLQLAAPPDQSQAQMPLLLMHVVNDALVGQWEHGGAKMEPVMKLVRIRASSSASR